MANDSKTFDPEAYCLAIRTWARQHPAVGRLDLMNMHDLARSANELDEWLTDPEAWIAAHPELPSN
jgi:hypothetical protein